jgi:hypothetical protein
MYGSILMAVTLRPVVFNSNPVDEAVALAVGEVMFGTFAANRTDDTLSNTANDATTDKDVLSHRWVMWVLSKDK